MLHFLCSILGNLARLRLGRRQLIALDGGLALPRRATAQRAEGTPVEENIWASYFREKNVWAHVDKHSVRPGEHFELLLSTSLRREQITGHVEIFRFTRINGDQKPPVWTSGPIEVARQRV